LEFIQQSGKPPWKQRRELWKMCGYQKTEKLQPQNADNAEWANRDRAGGNCEEEIDLRSGLKKL